MVWIGDRYYAVVGILAPVTLDSSIDRAALIGLPQARKDWDADATPAKTYLRIDDDRVTDVRTLVAATANPQNPEDSLALEDAWRFPVDGGVLLTLLAGSG